MTKSLIVIPFSSPLNDGCDYAIQTIFHLAPKHEVIGLALHDPYTWKDVCHDILHGHQNLYFQLGQATICRPLYLIPGQRWPIIKDLNLSLFARILRIWLRLTKSPGPKTLWMFEPYQTVPFFRVFKAWQTVYDCVDYFSLLNPEIQKKERELLKNASVVAVNSHVLFELHKPVRPDLLLVPLGFPDKLFAHVKIRPPNKLVSRKPIVGFIGGINHRLDFSLLEKVISKMPDVIFRFIGPQQGSNDTYHELSRLQKLSNTEWLAPIGKEKIGEQIQAFDIGIIPYDINQPFNRYCFPMKIFDYFYFGKPVVSTRIEELKRLEPLVKIADTPIDFIHTLQQLLNQPNPPARMRARKKMAIANSWQKKVATICLQLNTLPIS